MRSVKNAFYYCIIISSRLKVFEEIQRTYRITHVSISTVHYINSDYFSSAVDMSDYYFKNATARELVQFNACARANFLAFVLRFNAALNNRSPRRHISRSITFDTSVSLERKVIDSSQTYRIALAFIAS